MRNDCRIHSVAVYNSLGELEEVLSFTGEMFGLMCANNGHTYRASSGTLFESKKYNVLEHSLSDRMGNIHYTAHPNVKCVTLESKVVIIDPIKPTSNASASAAYSFNGEKVYNPNKQYSLHKGTYTFTNIPIEHPMGLDLATANGKVSYTGQQKYHPKSKDAGVKTTGIHYYWGDLTVTVRGDFGKMAVLCGLHGQMGDQAQLLVYKTENTCLQPPKVACVTLESKVVIIDPIKPTSNASASAAYSFNGEKVYNPNKQYSLHKGTYTFTNIPKEHPMGLDLATANGKVSYTGQQRYHPKSKDAGVKTTGIHYYWGDLTVTVYGDFGKMTVLCGLHGQMGDQAQLLVYKTDNTC